MLARSVSRLAKPDGNSTTYNMAFHQMARCQNPKLESSIYQVYQVSTAGAEPYNSIFVIHPVLEHSEY
ncbi:hypothetical protein A6R68_20377, partial [Neotoma lepida]